MMRKQFLESFKNEKGLSIIEVLTALSILSFVMVLMGGIFLQIQERHRQKSEEVNFIAVGNQVFTYVQALVKEQNQSAIDSSIYLKDNWQSIPWKSNAFFLEKDAATDRVIAITDQGTSNFYFVTEEMLAKKKGSVRLRNKEYKIKLIKQLAKNNQTKTLYYTRSDRMTYTMEQYVMVLIYKKEIPFENYYNATTGEWDIEGLKKRGEISYVREFTLDYRDQERARGALPQEGLE